MTLSSRGQVVIPKRVRERQKIRAGDDVHLFELSNGDILLRRTRRPRHSLVWHLRRLRGLEFARNREQIRKGI